MFSTKMFLLLRRMQIRLQKSEIFRVNNEKHSQFFGILNFFTKTVPLYLEAEKFRRPAKIHSISFQKRMNFLKPLNDFFNLFPWKPNMLTENPRTQSFCSKRRTTRIYKVPPKNYVISRIFFSNQVYCCNEIKIQNGFSQCVERL